MNGDFLTVIHGLLSSCDFIVKLVIATLKWGVSLLWLNRTRPKQDRTNIINVGDSEGKAWWDAIQDFRQSVVMRYQ